MSGRVRDTVPESCNVTSLQHGYGDNQRKVNSKTEPDEEEYNNQILLKQPDEEEYNNQIL